ncbi:MAG: magnesium/cobalt transporter CorA [Candidatus Cloacimonetes bacterium]|nr:magnesium/cobalt transporter CorA [Candidatus Cloacimonadota bacterium]
MAAKIKKVSKKVGQPPGTLMHIGNGGTEKAEISLIDYNKDTIVEKKVDSIEECREFKDKSTVTWINIVGLGDLAVIRALGNKFGIHPLVLEDIVNTGQRPKLEDFENYLFIVLKMIFYKDKEGEIETEQVSLIVGSDFVISLQEKKGDVFNPLRERIRNGKGSIRKMGSDYLTYTLIDTIIDNYFIVLEKVGEKLEDMEEELVSDPSTETLQAIHRLKREMIYLRKSVWPLREVITRLERGDSLLIKKSSHIYFRDIYDHTIQVMDAIETSREMLTGMLDIYLSSVSNRMNDVMKVLTIIATIFIPLTFIAGIYGMNFEYMPELGWRGAYFVVLFVMLVVGAGMIAYFKNKKWL